MLFPPPRFVASVKMDFCNGGRLHILRDLEARRPVVSIDKEKEISTSAIANKDKSNKRKIYALRRQRSVVVNRL